MRVYFIWKFPDLFAIPKSLCQQNLAFVADFEGFLREDFAAGLELLQMGMMFAKDLIQISLQIQWVLINVAMD